MKRNLTPASKSLLILIFSLFLAGGVLADGKMTRGASDAPPRSYSGAEPSPLNITFQDGLLSLDVRDVEIGLVLRNIAAKTGLSLTVAEGLRERVSLKLEAVSLECAMVNAPWCQVLTFDIRKAVKSCI